VNTDLLDPRTIEGLKVVRYEGWPGANSSVASVETYQPARGGGGNGKLHAPNSSDSIASQAAAASSPFNHFQPVNNEQNVHSTNILVSRSTQMSLLLI
jgi:hypothetical protein